MLEPFNEEKRPAAQDKQDDAPVEPFVEEPAPQGWQDDLPAP